MTDFQKKALPSRTAKLDTEIAITRFRVIFNSIDCYPGWNLSNDPEGVACENFKYIRPLQGRKTGIFDFSINIRPLWGRRTKALTEQ